MQFIDHYGIKIIGYQNYPIAVKFDFLDFQCLIDASSITANRKLPFLNKQTASCRFMKFITL